MGAYLARAALLMIIFFVLLFAADFVINAVSAGLSNSALAWWLILLRNFLLWVIILRLLTAIAGAALGAASGVGESWRATKGHWGVFAALALLLMILVGTDDLVSTWLLISLPVDIAWRIVATWISEMVGFSILTTLYGYFVEKRPLESMSGNRSDG